MVEKNFCNHIHDFLFNARHPKIFQETFCEQYFCFQIEGNKKSKYIKNALIPNK